MSKIIEHPLKPDLALFFVPPEFTQIFGENFDYSIGNYKNILERISTVVEEPSFVGVTSPERVSIVALSLAHTACEIVEKKLNWTWCDLEFADSQITIPHALVSPDQKYVLNPVGSIYRFLTSKQKTLKLVLTINMILAGNLPPSSDGEYTILSS